MNWIQHPVILEDSSVKLLPLIHSHIPDLVAIGRQGKIWECMSIDGTDAEKLTRLLTTAILKRTTGDQYPFVVIDKQTDKITGSTMFHNIFLEHRKLEIGWTWYDPAMWRTGHNRACKLLLLTYCFEVLKTVRVQFQTDENNIRSRSAILGIGATFEGIMRKERIRANGAFRNTVMYSIIDNEWPHVKRKLIDNSSRFLL